MATILHQMTEIYVFVDDMLKTHPHWAEWRRSPNGQPEFTDAEVLTMALLQGPMGVATLKQTYELIVANDGAAFPKVVTYPQWLHRLHRLSEVVGRLLAATRPAAGLAVYVADSKPIPVCLAWRHRCVRLLREDGAYFGKTSKGWFFGFKLHVLRSLGGRVVDAILTPANWDDRDPALALALSVDGGIVIGDLGYRGPRTANLLAEEADLLLITKADGPDHKALLAHLRQPIEAFFSHLWYHFLDRVFSRSWNGLWNPLKLKLLTYNLVHAGLVSA